MNYVTAQGVDVPAIGLGTYQLRGNECTSVVETALEMGYRHIDTAEFYSNQAAVGDAIAGAPVDREELFVTTKIWKTNLKYDQAVASATESLEKLDIGYIDLLLIHWPNTSVPTAETVQALNHLQEEGVGRHIGVSNFSVAQLEDAVEASETPILANQIPYNPMTDQSDLLEWCVSEDVLLTAYSPLGKGSVVGNETLATIGQRYEKSAPQVALRWLIQQPMVAAIPKASSRDHLAANLDVFDFELTSTEMEQIFDLQGGLLSQLRRKLEF
ncbi:aldo/keto reductase [Saliphagus infecundisoli]|uniref:Aldo/keto reductase n=1 Tax=Saliphagus infecundisoli TaxID=1849069 RepID=A0ABD5QCA7_9EURY|nr:aldo/keto reductase [Saliphagus infecundisoli]